MADKLKNKENSIVKFPSDWFPYGATLVSTMTRWGHCGQELKEWVAELSSDLESMKRHGMTSVGIMMDWELIEPAEGQFDFRKFDPIIKKAEKLGLRVALWPWEEVCPEWVARNHPDWRWEADDGSRPPLGCWHNPGFQGAVHRMLREVVKRYKNSPALLMWNVAIEPMYRIDGQGITLSLPYTKMYCYQPATLAKYREWLQVRYAGKLDVLNRKWQTFYPSWEEVVPPRTDPWSNMFNVRFLDWRVFWTEALTAYQCGKAACVKELDTIHPTTGNAGWSGMSGAGPDSHRMVEGFDSFGVSWFPIYPKRSSVRATHLSYGYMRSACWPNKPMFLHELQGGPYVSGAVMGETPDPRELVQWCWQAIGAGFRGIYYWAWRPHRSGGEAGGFGLTNLDGSDTGRTRSAAEVAPVLQKQAELLNRVSPAAPEVAILFSPINNVLGSAMIRVVGPQRIPQHAWSLKMYHGALNTLRTPVHIVKDEDLQQLIDGNLSQIKVLVIPYMPIMRDEWIAILEKFVRRGGVIWSDPWMAQRDEVNICRDTPLPSWVGCSQGLTRPIVAPIPINRVNQWRGQTVVKDGSCKVALPGGKPVNLASFFHEVSLDPQKGAVVLGRFQNGSVGLLRNSHGKGEIYYSGSFFALAAKNKCLQIGFDEKDAENGVVADDCQPSNPGFLAVLRSVLARAGVTPPIQAEKKECLPMEASLLVGEDEALAIFINHGAKAIKSKWKIQSSSLVSKKTKAVDILSNRPVPVSRAEGGALVVEVNLPVYGVAAVLLR